jgi:hypothetical protein
MKTQEIEVASDLDIAADELLAAWQKYRAFIKRNYPDRLFGVMIVKRGKHEMILHSESQKYTNQIMRLTFDPKSDSFGLHDANYLEE